MKKSGIELIAEERKRQIEIEGWTPENDDVYVNDELSRAGALKAGRPLFFRLLGTTHPPVSLFTLDENGVGNF